MKPGRFKSVLRLQHYLRHSARRFLEHSCFLLHAGQQLSLPG